MIISFVSIPIIEWSFDAEVFTFEMKLDRSIS
jgi:hypothetical protein